ncbi:hypothetical protein PJI17_16815 [Mycobacterium kansasii]
MAHAEHDVVAPARGHRPRLDRHMVGAERCGQTVDLRLPGLDGLADQ